MRKLALLMILVATPVSAKVVNVEFKFTPFVGDPAKADMVTTVEGQARVLLNGVPVVEQEVGSQQVPVLFDEREVAPAVWVPVDSIGPVLRKGRNTIRFEFEPKDAKAAYRAQLRWASVNDETTTTGDAAAGTATNQSGEGVDSRQATGKVAFDHDFVADFAVDRPWHHYPAVTALSDDDRKILTVMLESRLQAFKPDFAALYALLKSNPHVDVAAIRSARCVDKAYAAGVRMNVAPADQVEFVTTGGPAVVVRARSRELYRPEKPSSFEKIKGDEAQMCAGMALISAFPPRLVAVHAPSGAWELVP